MSSPLGSVPTAASGSELCYAVSELCYAVDGEVGAVSSTGSYALRVA